MVHQPPRGSQEPDGLGLQSHGRDQYRRFVAGARRLEPPGYPAARAGDAQEPAPRDRAPGVWQDRPDQVHRRSARPGQPGGLCRRRGRHRLIAQVRHELRALVHRRGYSLRPEQAVRRRLPWQQDRSDLLQHDGRRWRPARGARRIADEHGRRDRTAAVRR